MLSTVNKYHYQHITISIKQLKVILKSPGYSMHHFQVRSFGQWAAATCAAQSSVIAGQYATLNCKPWLVMFM